MPYFVVNPLLRLNVSLIQTNASRGLVPTWLGIFAILMLFVAPVISRSLEHTRVGCSETTSMADFGMKMLMHHQSTNPPQAQPGAPPPMMHANSSHNMAMMMDDNACGYCTLLIHVPLLDLAQSPLFWFGSIISWSLPIHYIFPLFAHVVHTELQPRAPPISLR